MKELDKTKQNIRVNEIDMDQRKDLFNKFKDAGGQVLTEKEKKRNLVIDREKQKQYKQRLDEHYSSQKIPSTKRVVSKKPASSSYVSMQTSPFDRFRIRMRLRLLGITGLNTGFFKIAFFKKFNDHYKPSLIEIQMIYLTLFKKDLRTGNRIIRSLDKITPIYYELIEKSGDLFKPYLIGRILEDYSSFPDVPQLISEKKELYIELFRMLYILKPYENSIYNSFEKSIDLYLSYREEKKDKSIKKKNLKNSLFIIFDKLYPRLHTLFCQYQGILFSESDRAIEDILAILPSEKPGNRIRISENKPIKTDIEEDEIIAEDDSDTETENTPVSNAVREGLKLMYSLDNKTLRSLYDKKGEFELLNNSDKVLLTYLLFMEFEKEYSFILTTNQIKYNVDFSSYAKIDFKSKMQDIYNSLNKCRDHFKLYYEAFLEYNKVVKEKPLSNDQYIAYSKRLDEIAKKMKNVGSMSRMVIKSFMENLASELNNLLEDINENQRYISNPQDVLEFSYGIEGDKKLNSKKIYEAIEMIYNYASALSYRIGPEGDLSGKLEFEEGDKQFESGDLKTEKSENPGESLFTELDDII